MGIDPHVRHETARVHHARRRRGGGVAARGARAAAGDAGDRAPQEYGGVARYVTAFREGLGEAGFVEGQNVAIDYRWANNQPDRLPEMAADLVRRGVTVISTNGFATPAAMAATATIPIVFTTGFDPVRTGLVASLGRPGGNVTGVVFTVTDLVGKQLGLLHELVPNAAIIAVLMDPNQLEIGFESQEAEAAGRAIGRQILIVKAASEREFDAALATLVQAGAGALLIHGSPTFLARRRQLVVLATRHGCPRVTRLANMWRSAA